MRNRFAEKPYPVTSDDVVGFLGDAGLDKRMVIAHIEMARDLVEGYTRGEGFTEAGDPYGDVRRVIIGVAARSVTNPLGLQREQAGTQTVAYGRFEGFTLAEQKVLNRYRQMAS